MSRAFVLGLAFALACSPESASEGDSLGEGTTETTTEGTTETTTDTTGDQPCTLIECSMTCASEPSECGPPLIGNCIDGVCECSMLPECLPCLPEKCGLYEDCRADWTYGGECDTACHYEFPPFAWDPDVGCVLMLPPDVPHDFLDWFRVEIGGFEVPRTRSCEAPAEPGAYVLDNDTLTLSLCPDACLQFELAGALLAMWSIPCE